MALTKAKLMELIDNGDIDVGGGGGNPNILHNWDFRNPVNQRGVSGAISTGTYFYDRWIRNSGTVTVNAGYLTLASGAVIEQRIEGNLLAGVLCTVSFEIDSTIYTGTGVFPVNNGTVSVEVDGYPDITFGCATGYMFVLIPATSNTSIKRLKCEMGTVSTLHLDPPMDHAVELLKCQRYFFKLGTTNRLYARFPNAVAVGSTLLGCYVQFPSRMRNIPTFYYTGSLSDYGTVTSNNFTDIVMTDDGVSEGGAFIYFTTSGVTDGHVYSIRAYNSTNASLCFSADL